MQSSVIFLTFTIYSVEILCENKMNKDVNLDNKLILLGYIHGYKISHDSVLKYPGILVSPIIVVPALNRKQNMNIQINSDEKMARNNSAVASKILLDDTNDIEVHFRQALERGNGSKKDLRQVKTKESLKRTGDVIEDKNTDNTTINSELLTLETSTMTENVTHETTTVLHTTTETHGLYPNAVYNNQDVNSLTITVKDPDDVLNPPLVDEQWKNFTLSTNISLKENKAKEKPSNSLNITGYPSVNETDSPIKGVYPAALYNNAEIDQLSITTNSYTNRSPLSPPQDDKWTSSASLRKNLPTSNEFRPLAGLYYDGFLHKPIHKTQGFVPYNHYPLRSLQ